MKQQRKDSRETFRLTVLAHEAHAKVDIILGCQMNSRTRNLRTGENILVQLNKNMCCAWAIFYELLVEGDRCPVLFYAALRNTPTLKATCFTCDWVRLAIYPASSFPFIHIFISLWGRFNVGKIITPNCLAESCLFCYKNKAAPSFVCVFVRCCIYIFTLNNGYWLISATANKICQRQSSFHFHFVHSLWGVWGEGRHHQSEDLWCLRPQNIFKNCSQFQCFYSSHMLKHYCKPPFFQNVNI